jgi:hypothetical protein
MKVMTNYMLCNLREKSHIIFEIFFWVGLEFELRASHLQSRHSAT